MLKKIGVDSKITSNPDDLSEAKGIILPGVGRFDYGMSQLKKANLTEQLNYSALEKKTPILGICLGAQLLCSTSEEGNLAGLNWIKAKVLKFNNLPNGCPVPHMGWNYVFPKKNTLFSTSEMLRYYFVHSYYIHCESQENIMAESKYGDIFFHSAIIKDNIMGVQFHPEKSHKYGFHMMKKFTEIVSESNRK